MRQWLLPLGILTAAVAAVELGLIVVPPAEPVDAFVRAAVGVALAVGYLLIVVGLVVIGAIRAGMRAGGRYRGRRRHADRRPVTVTAPVVADEPTEQYPVITTAHWPTAVLDLSAWRAR